MHKYFIFLAAFLLAFPETPRTSDAIDFFISIPSTQQIEDEDSPEYINQSTYDGAISALNHHAYHLLYIYSITSSDEEWSDVRYSIPDSLTFRTDYVQLFCSRCRRLNWQFKELDSDKKIPEISFITTAIAAIENKDNRAGYKYGEKFAIQAIADITNRHTQNLSFQTLTLSDVQGIKNLERACQVYENRKSIKFAFLANRQEFYKELIPTLQQMYPGIYPQTKTTSFQPLEIEGS